VLILVAFYDTHELRWGYSLLPATTRGRTGYIRLFSHVTLFQDESSCFGKVNWDQSHKSCCLISYLKLIDRTFETPTVSCIPAFYCHGAGSYASLPVRCSY